MNDTILLVEDDANDVFFLKHAFKDVGIPNPLHVASDGREAINYLKGEGQYANREKFPLPCLVLMDLKLPRVMGLEVLKWIREQPELHTLIVIIFSSSQLEPDIESAYQLGTNAYVVKPSTPRELRELANGIKQFWLKLNHGPTPHKEPAHHVANGD